MKSNLISIFFCAVIGISLSFYIFRQYDENKESTPVSNITNNLKFIQNGVYSSKDSMEEATKNLKYYIFSEENDKYYVYIGITTEKNLEKVKGYYESLGYDIYVKDITINNKSFLDVLNQYELMLKELNNTETIGNIEGQVLSKYEELVIGEQNQ